jgi:AhpD family alkylhydroperoxidase
MSLALLAKQRPPVARALYKLKNEVFRSGALSVREKELIAVALSCLIKCETCLRFHSDRAKEAGATKEQLREAMDIALYLAGPSILIWSPTIDEIVSDGEIEE